ncbi:SDR family oxidoreductase [Pedobacter sp. UYP1]|uniref:SDR family oxidoreductase n=1 Tax=Pedobacter sp. UYP1 TaxID=1756396 RepID=UPI003391734B
MILVTGATGHLGKATIDSLLEKGIQANQISALVREEAKAQDLKAKGVTLKIGDYDDYISLVTAFKDVDKLFLISGTDVVNRSKQQESVIRAAKQIGVKRIYYTSFERKNDTETSPVAFLAESHLYTENLIKASGISYTIFRNNMYLDALPFFVGENFSQTGVFFPAGETKSAFASRRDMAEAVANVLTSEGHDNKTYFISNTENISMREVAEIIGNVTGKPVNYISPTPEVYADALSKADVPAEFVRMLSGTAEAIKQGEFSSEKTDLENLLGRKPTSAKEFLTQFYSKK